MKYNQTQHRFQTFPEIWKMSDISRRPNRHLHLFRPEKEAPDRSRDKNHHNSRGGWLAAIFKGPDRRASGAGRARATRRQASLGKAGEREASPKLLKLRRVAEAAYLAVLAGYRVSS